jgi:hypothetical protein
MSEVRILPGSPSLWACEFAAGVAGSIIVAPTNRRPFAAGAIWWFMAASIVGGKMAKRASAAKKSSKQETEQLEVNPGVSASGCWLVYRASPLQTLSVYADHLDVTENGSLIFFIGGSNNAPPQAVIAGNQYLYCTKVR